MLRWQVYEGSELTGGFPRLSYAETFVEMWFSKDSVGPIAIIDSTTGEVVFEREE